MAKIEIMLSFDWVKRRHKTKLKTILENPVVCCLFFLPRGFPQLPSCLLATFTNQEAWEHNDLLLKEP